MNASPPPGEPRVKIVAARRAPTRATWTKDLSPLRRLRLEGPANAVQPVSQCVLGSSHKWDFEYGQNSFGTERGGGDFAQQMRRHAADQALLYLARQRQSSEPVTPGARQLGADTASRATLGLARLSAGLRAPGAAQRSSSVTLQLICRSRMPARTGYSARWRSCSDGTESRASSSAAREVMPSLGSSTLT